MIDLNKMSREELIDELRSIEYRVCMVMEGDETFEGFVAWWDKRSQAADQGKPAPLRKQVINAFGKVVEER